ncbi:MAG: hypothetical protein JWP89_618 [Schlesneria sp.]|nr:hypothetical protein [Schlesneria sp.]
MGANSFVVCYGLRWEIDSGNQEEQVTQLEEHRDARQLAARQHKLDCWWGVIADEERYFLLIGKLIGRFGWEGKYALQLADSEATGIVEETRRLLVDARFEETPAWYYQFEPEF